MKLTRGHVQVETKLNGEIAQIYWNEHALLHDGTQWWNKTYPMIFPVTSFSRAFWVNGKNYELPKHGFWNTLNWVMSTDEAKSYISFGTMTQGDATFPFRLAIYHQIKPEVSGLTISTTFANASDETAYFHFGHHPAFKIDATSYVKASTNPQPLALQTGRLGEAKVALNAPLMQLPFGAAYDTLSFKNHALSTLQLVNARVTIDFDFTDFASLQLWKPASASFICVEPWQATNDDESEVLISEAAQKRNIIDLKPGETKTWRFAMHFSKTLV